MLPRTPWHDCSKLHTFKEKRGIVGIKDLGGAGSGFSYVRGSMETLGPPYKTILCRVFETLYHPPRHFSQLSRCCDCETALRIMWCISLRYGRQRTARQAQLLPLRAQRRQSNKASDSVRVDPRVTRPVSPPPRPSEDLDLTVYNHLVIAHSFCSSSPSAGQRGIIRGAMEDRELLKLAWDWALRQDELLKTVLPVMMEMESCLIEDRKPTPEQVGRWTTLQSQVTQKMLELNADVDQLRRAIDPLFGFDA